MADQGTSFQIDLAVGGAAAVEAASSSLDNLTKQLTAAGVASRAANDALKAGQAVYQSAATDADKTAKALERVGAAADAQRGKLQKAMDVGDTASADKAAAKLRTLVTQQDALAIKSKAAKTALDQEAASLDKLKANVTNAEKAEEQLTKDQDKATKALKAANDAVSKAAGSGDAGKIASNLGKLGGPLGKLGQKIFDVKDSYGKLGEALGDSAPEVIAAVGITGVVVALVALSAAAIAGAVSVGIWAVGLADAARSNRLLSQGIAQSVAGGDALSAKINQLATQVPLTTDELASMAATLAKTGLKGDALTSTLEQNATAAAKLKFGPDFAKQMTSLTEQSKRLQIGVSSIFGGLKIDKLLDQLSSLVDLFNADDAAGQGLKVLFETLFQPLVDGVVDFIPKARAAFLQLEILALKAAIAIKPYTSKIEEVGEAFLLLGAVLVGVVLVAFAALAAWAAIGVAAIAAVVAVLYKAGEGTIQIFTDVRNFLSSFSLADMGAQMIQGLINGITGAGGAVVGAVKGVVNGAIDSAKEALGIHSPSKVFAEIGMNTAAGMTQGVEGGSNDVQGAIEGITSSPASSAAAAPASSSASGGGSSGGFNFQGAVFTFNGVKDADDAESRFGAMLTKILEGDVSQIGAAVPT